MGGDRDIDDTFSESRKEGENLEEELATVIADLQPLGIKVKGSTVMMNGDIGLYDILGGRFLAGCG